MCNRLPEIYKNGDAGIFPVYYSLKIKYRKITIKINEKTQRKSQHLREKYDTGS